MILRRKDTTLLLTCLVARFITLNEADSEICVDWNDKFGEKNSLKSKLLFATYFSTAKDSFDSLLYSVENFLTLYYSFTKQ